MAAKSKSRASGDYTFKHNAVPNALEHREKTRKANQCQLCGTKTPLKDQFTVVNDLEAGTVKKQKNAARKGAEKLSHYCSDCAGKRVKQKEAWLKSRDESSNGSSKSKAAKPKKSSKTSGKKRSAAAKASAKEADPF